MRSRGSALSSSAMYKPVRSELLSGSRSSRRNAEVTEQVVESQNDELSERLNQRVDTLKSLTLEIGLEAQEQNRMLDTMQMDFGKAGQFLSGTMKKLTEMMNTGSSKNMCYLALFAFFIFMLLYFLVFR